MKYNILEESSIDDDPEQDWEEGITTWTFLDGSWISVQENDVSVSVPNA